MSNETELDAAIAWYKDPSDHRRVMRSYTADHWAIEAFQAGAAYQLQQDKGLVEALEAISAIEDRYNCGDWDEIAEARRIADEALYDYRAAQGEKP